MSDLTDPQISDLRRNWIRDEWVDSPLFKGISHFNTANQREFFTDTMIKAIDDYVMNQYAETLEGVNTFRYQARLDSGDDSVTADAAGVAAERYARYRLIRAEAFERMVMDPGFRATLSEENAALNQMTVQIVSDRTFVSSRTGLVTVPLRRA